jgi:hypothetical protein
MKSFKSIKGLLAAGVLAAVAAQPASAAFSNGDLILSFQATGGLGATTTYAANLGAGYTYRDATANSLNVINLGSALSSIYGGTWYDRTDLYINLIGVRQIGGGPASSNYGPVVNGDTRQTVYAGRAKADNNPETFNQYTGLGFGGGTQIMDLNATVGTALASVNQASIPTSTVNTIEDYTTPPGILLANFIRFGNADFNQAFSSGTLFTYNSVGYEGALTLQRLIRTDATTGTSAGQIIIPGAPAGSGSNEGFFAIRSTGQVDYIAPIPEPGTWAAMALFAGGAAFAGWRKRRMAKANA